MTKLFVCLFVCYEWFGSRNADKQNKIKINELVDFKIVV